jgi:predicted transcriptional regulator
MAGRPERPRFSDLESEVMGVLWEGVEATAEEVRHRLPGRDLTDSSVRTLLRRLEAKGYVEHSTDGRRFIFRATMERPEAAAAAVHRVVERICGGAVDTLLVGMIKGGLLRQSEIERLQEILRQLTESEGSEGEDGA